MEKRKGDPVVPEMRKRLLANREGRLMTGQWVDLIVQPLVILALVSLAAFLVFGEDMLLLLDEAWWVILPVIAILVFLPVFTRAYRYARIPVHFARLRAGVQPWWGFWKPLVFYTDADEPVTFRRRLAPRPLLKIDGEYLVYFLEEPQGKILLSAAPSDHPDAELWTPTQSFEIRHERRRP